jgi:uncharacterized protein (TIGR00266 family)
MAEQKGGPVLFQYEPLVSFHGGQVVREERKEQPLTYFVKGRPAFAFVDIFLKKDQKCVADAGAMLWMESTVQIETGCYGGCCSAFARTCSGESCCQNMFTGPGGEGAGEPGMKVTFGFELPGDMLPFLVKPGEGWVLTRKAFVCGTENCVVSARFAGCLACCFSGEGPFLTKVTVPAGEGMFFAGAYGALERHQVNNGQIFLVDTGLFFAAHEAVNIGVGLAGGLKTCCFGGEAWVMKFTGPAVIYTKSRDPAIFDRLGGNGGQQGAQQGAQAGQGIAGALG